MPGLKQLQEFNSDILKLGNETELRAAREEKPVTVPIPDGVQDIDDSAGNEYSESGADDFPFDDTDFSDIDLSDFDMPPGSDTGETQSENAPSAGEPSAAASAGNEPGLTSFDESLFDNPAGKETPRALPDFDAASVLKGLDTTGGDGEESEGRPIGENEIPSMDDVGVFAPQSELDAEEPEGSTAAESAKGAPQESAAGAEQPVTGAQESEPPAAGAQVSAGADDFDLGDLGDIGDLLADTENKTEGEESPEEPPAGGDFDLGKIDAPDSDSEFEIPGFSSAKAAPDEAEAASTDTADASDASAGRKKKNTFTDAEYKKFQTNLATYPLNVRIALEDFVVKNEFTDDVVFSVLEKVLRKVPARQLAADLENLLDIHLDVPRNYERRSALEYETHKQSLEYQLKNRIIPGALFTAAAAVVIFLIFTLSNNFIYRPLRASRYYRQGYELLQSEQYPQSEERFNQALTYRPMKRWFFRYAQGYREHRQYDRARMMYRAVLQRYDHDKQAGLDWANMEVYDLYNYEEGERILRREVLDYHINDADAILALGDTYLEWATESDPEKFPLAKEQYDLLLQLYDANNLYLSRQMRYFIRTDNLGQVLNYKNALADQRNALSSSDLIELSEYLLDKRYGELSPAEENLRMMIEDVRRLLERALESAPQNPVALYNMARYFQQTNDGQNAASLFEAAIDSFASQERRTREETYKYINAYRLLGEEMRDEREYITAEEMYGNGIDLFERERESGGFESTPDIGALYADLADLDYFITGDDNAALANYENAVNNNYDTASVRYKIGYIQYQRQNYPAALGSFIKTQDSRGNDTHLLLALANTLSLSNDNHIARGYYEQLLSILNVERGNSGTILPQVREDHADLVDTYMKASNNLGVTLSRLAAETGDSALNARSIVYLQESLRAWDALTRNQTTMVRLGGSNLAEQNIRYLTNPVSDYTAEIYTEIPRLLYGEQGLG